MTNNDHPHAPSKFRRGILLHEADLNPGFGNKNFRENPSQPDQDARLFLVHDFGTMSPFQYQPIWLEYHEADLWEVTNVPEEVASMLEDAPKPVIKLARYDGYTGEYDYLEIVPLTFGKETKETVQGWVEEIAELKKQLMHLAAIINQK